MSLTSNRIFFKNFVSSVVKDSPLPGLSGGEIIVISINLTGTRLVNSRTDKSLRVWKCTPDNLVDPVIIEHPHEKAVESVSWEPKSEFTFATAGKDDKIKIWRTTGTLEKEIKVTKHDDKGGDVPVQCKFVDYSNDGAILSVVDRDSMVFLYNVAENYALAGRIQLDAPIYDLQWFNSAHDFFICALHNGTLPVYQVLPSEALNQNPQKSSLVSITHKHALIGHRSSANCVAIDPRGAYFAVGSNEGVVSIWSTLSMICTRVITNTDEPISKIAISRDGAYLAAAYDHNSNIKIFDYDTTDQVFEVPNSLSGKLTFPTICWFPSKTCFVYTSDSGRTMNLMRKP